MNTNLPSTNFRADLGEQRFVTREERTHNSTHPKGGVSCSKDSFVVNGSFVVQIKFCGKSPALRELQTASSNFNDKTTQH